jgi:hypothetical protein
MGGASPEYMGYEDKYADELAESIVSFSHRVLKLFLCLSGIAGLIWVIQKIIH